MGRLARPHGFLSLSIPHDIGGTAHPYRLQFAKDCARASGLVNLQTVDGLLERRQTGYRRRAVATR